MPNCSTRTTREYLRFNLPEATYRKLYNIISGQDKSVDLEKVKNNAHELNVEKYFRTCSGEDYTCTISGDDKWHLTVSPHMAKALDKMIPERAVKEKEDTYAFQASELTGLLAELSAEEEFGVAFANMLAAAKKSQSGRGGQRPSPP